MNTKIKVVKKINKSVKVMSSAAYINNSFIDDGDNGFV